MKFDDLDTETQKRAEKFMENHILMAFRETEKTVTNVEFEDKKQTINYTAVKVDSFLCQFCGNSILRKDLLDHILMHLM